MAEKVQLAAANRLSEEEEKMAHEMTGEMQSCIDECLECHRICVETAAHCLALGGKHAEADHITALLDCAEICQTSANFMLRGSPDHGKTCGVCAKVCDRCADSCESMGEEDDLMRRCAQTCRTCAESCREMAETKSRA
jgi:hypothetical protein